VRDAGALRGVDGVGLLRVAGGQLVAGDSTNVSPAVAAASTVAASA